MNLTPKQARAALHAALGSGDYTQTTDTLYRIDASGKSSMCCLGVACDLYMKLEGKGKWEPLDYAEFAPMDNTRPTPQRFFPGVEDGEHGNRYDLPGVVRDWLGFETTIGGRKEGHKPCLANVNDTSQDYDKVAALIGNDEIELQEEA